MGRQGHGLNTVQLITVNAHRSNRESIYYSDLLMVRAPSQSNEISASHQLPEINSPHFRQRPTVEPISPIELIFYQFFLPFSQKMDMNRDGVVTLDEFLDCCRNDDAISRSMAVFDSSF